MAVEIETEIRNTKITFYADNFTEDPSVGLFYGPDECWATTESGEQFELTEDEESELSEQATDIMRGR